MFCSIYTVVFRKLYFKQNIPFLPKVLHEKNYRRAVVIFNLNAAHNVNEVFLARSHIQFPRCISYCRLWLKDSC